ncbi:MAG: hypothetical protein PVJ09_01845, partial [Candidatus Woesebacteria bacterium]
MSSQTSFKGNLWQEEINTRDFIFANLTAYDGDASFLQGPTENTKRLWDKCKKLLVKEVKKGGVL